MEWMDEPNREEFEHAGLKCLILRNPELLNLNGYVALPPEHPCYGKADIDVEVHGGLTFASEGDGEKWEKGYWWVGFDCGHAGDLVPAISEYLPMPGIYRNFAYVRAAVKTLAEQLAKLAPSKEDAMGKGVSKYWTPGKEIEYQERLKNSRTFAERHLTMLFRDLLKYDGRSKEARKAIAQARLRIATASDKDITEIAKLEASMQEESPGEIPGLARASFEAQRLRELQKDRVEIKERGIRKEELECQ